MKARTLNEDEVMATLTLPYTDPADGTKLASIHSNPPGVPTDYCAATYRSYGKGKVVWVSAPLETVEHGPHREIFAGMVRALAAGPFSFEAKEPAAVEVTVFHQPDNRRYLVNLVNEQENLPPIPVHDMKVTLRMEGKTAVGAALLPDERPLPFATREGEVELVVPKLDIFCMLMVTYE